jgi:hypothetical protein
VAQTPEGRVKAAIKKYLVAKGAWFCCPATGGYGSSGTPDFLVCYKGRFIAIEAKRPGGKPTTLQTDAINAINRCGGTAFVCDDVSALDNIFRAVDLLVRMEALERAVEVGRGT